jgi:hypothetical protein
MKTKIRINVAAFLMVAATVATAVAQAPLQLDSPSDQVVAETVEKSVQAIQEVVDPTQPETPEIEDSVAPVAPVPAEVQAMPSTIVDGGAEIDSSAVPVETVLLGPDEMSVTVAGCSACMPAPVITECDCCQDACKNCCSRRKVLKRGCGCKRAGCRGGSSQSCEAAPCATTGLVPCEGDTCKLELTKVEVKKTCFKAEQVSVCVPAVRLPWMKCCPPGTSKTRLVTKLSVEKDTVEKCGYKWKLVEADEGYGSEDETQSEVPVEAAPQTQEIVPAKDNTEGQFEEAVVPAAPAVKGAFLKPWRKR